MEKKLKELMEVAIDAALGREEVEFYVTTHASRNQQSFGQRKDYTELFCIKNGKHGRSQYTMIRWWAVEGERHFGEVRPEEALELLKKYYPQRIRGVNL